jgi:hypothetical protein
MMVPLTLAAPPAAAMPAQPVRYGFAGAAMGLSLQDWRRVRPDAACAPPAGPHAAVRCMIADQPIGGGFLARDLTYVFVGGQLAQIRFHTSIDGFSNLVARLKRDYGDPADIRRDSVKLYGVSLPHVEFRWRNGRSTIDFSDPAGRDQIAARITLDADAALVNAS